MIKSGLVNRRLGGGFEKGYPHERDTSNVVERPAVFKQDGTVMAKSTYASPLENKVILPEQIVYGKLFGKGLTADERLYILRQIQDHTKNQRSRGIEKRGRPRREAGRVRGIENEKKPLPAFPAVPAPGVPGIPAEDQPPIQPDTDEVNPLDQELYAEQVVTPPWLFTQARGALRNASAATAGFILGDIGGIVPAIETAYEVDKFYNPEYFIEETIASNGDGPIDRVTGSAGSGRYNAGSAVSV